MPESLLAIFHEPRCIVYLEAWKRLTERYDNKRIIVNTHLSDLFSPQKRKCEIQFRDLLTKFNGLVCRFEIIGYNTT